MREQGHSKAESMYAAAGTEAARATGVENLSYALWATDPVTGEEYSGPWRAAYAATGSVQVVGTALGINAAGKKVTDAVKKGWNGAKKWWNNAPKTAPNAYNHNYSYADRVRKRAMEDPHSHNFPYSFDDSILSVQPIEKKNGYKIYQLTGEMNGKKGVYEIGITKDGIIDHRFFRPSTIKIE